MPGMPPGFGFPSPGGAAAPSPFGGPGAFDTTATSAPGAGSRFEATRAREEAARAAAAAGTSTSTSSPSSSSSSSADAAKKPSFASAFKDVSDEPSSSSSGGNGSASTSSFSGAEANGGEEIPKKKISSDLLDGFFRDPSIQEMFYQHLPEEMRNPETFEWILSNPENRAQLEAMVEAQAGNLDPNAFVAGGMGNAGDMTAKLAVSFFLEFD